MSKKKKDNTKGGSQHSDVTTSTGKPPQNRKRMFIFAGVVVFVFLAVIVWVRNHSGTETLQDKDTKPVVTVADNNTATTSTDGHGPSIQFLETEYDFGSVSQGEKVSHTFIVKNTGDEPLKIIRAKGS